MLRVLSNMGMQPLESTEQSTVSICSTDSMPYVWENCSALLLSRGPQDEAAWAYPLLQCTLHTHKSSDDARTGRTAQWLLGQSFLVL